MALCSIGPRHVIAWSASSRKYWIDIVFTPVREVRGMILRWAETCGRPSTPSMRGIE